MRWADPRKAKADKLRRAEQARKAQERQRERDNQESLDFMQWVRSSPTYQLEAKWRTTFADTWESVALERELTRRGNNDGGRSGIIDAIPETERLRRVLLGG